MVKVRFYGTMRSELGMAELEVDASTVGQALDAIAAADVATKKALKDCIPIVDGHQVRSRTPLREGAVLMLMSPAGGG